MAVTHNDWRNPAQLVTLYKHYARCAGRYYGKHLYEGDWYPLRQGMKDIRDGLFAWTKRLYQHEPRHHNQQLELPFWVPVGILEGWLESRRLAKNR